MNVTEMQNKLIKLGYTITNTTDTINQETKIALKMFQKDVGLLSDGIFGKKTESILESLSTTKENEPNNVQRFSRFFVTSYMVASENDYGNHKSIPVKTTDGKILATVDPYFFCNMSLEGTGKLEDGRILNVTGDWIDAPAIVKKEVLPISKSMFGDKYQYGGINATATRYLSFKEMDSEMYPWGVGVANTPLELWKTLAADLGTGKRSDPKFKLSGGLVPLNTDVYIKELDGLSLPDNTIHNGWCKVGDTGSGIYGAHFDWFVGTKKLQKQIKRNNILHVWFDGIESKIPSDYNYGIK